MISCGHQRGTNSEVSGNNPANSKTYNKKKRLTKYLLYILSKDNPLFKLVLKRQDI